ncbi:MAG: S1 RNA-binding domain-containing protein [Ruminococcaceae bacterium]|nr:S1 RNA-binding domain-containing protein [Oscillospiraceae bacterium]MBQ9913614.1 S1 RNA-binding domain-containing protein [Clostridia bacterium]
MLEVGAVLEGKVTGLTAFGAFVSLPDGKSGMVHISEVSNGFVKDIKEFLKEGQTVKVKIVSISEEGKISLSIRKAEEAPKRENSRPPRKTEKPARANVWQGQPKQNKEAMSFEDMMARFKQVSDEKMTDLKRNSDSKHGGGYSRRGSGRS